MSKTSEGNSQGYSGDLASWTVKILTRGSLSGMLESFADLLKELTSSVEAELYIFEKEHEQLRLMFGDEEKSPPKIKLKDGLSALEKVFPTSKKLLNFFLHDEFIGLGVVDGKGELSDDTLSKLAGILKLCLGAEAKRATIYKLSTLERLDSMLSVMPMEFDVLFQRVLNFAAKILNAEKGSIWMVGDRELVLSYTFGTSEDEILRRRVGFGNGLIGWMAEHVEPFLSTSFKSDERVTNDIFTFKVKSAIGVPLVSEGRFVGIMVLFNRKNTDFYRTYRHFDEFDLSILSGIADKTMLSYSRIELYLRLKKENEALKRLQKQTKEYIIHQREQVRLLNALQKIMKAMKSSQDVKNVYRIMLVGLTSGRGFGFNRALLLVKDEENRVLEAKDWLGPASYEEVSKDWQAATQRESAYADFSQYLREEALHLTDDGNLTKIARGRTFSYTGDYIFDRVINRGKIVHITETLAKERGHEFLDLLNFLKVEEFVCVPLMGRGQVYGAVILDNKYTRQPINDDMIEMLRLFSESVGLTIESIKNYLELKEKTSTLERQKMIVEYLKDFSQNVLENLDVAIVVVDRENRILEWNRKSEELFGFSKEKVVNSTVNILGPEFFDLFNVAEKVYTVKETISLNEYSLNFDGKEMFLNVKFSPFFEKETNVISGYVAMFEDVTKEHMMEMELRTQERLAVLGEMSARVAHEIRNPLSAIGGFAQRARKIAEDEKMKRYLGIILNETRRLEELVNQTLEFSRSNLNSNFEERSVNGTIKEAVELYMDKAREKHVELTLNLSQDVKTMLEPNHFKEVVMNLVQNALEAVEEKEGKIKVMSRSTENEVIVEVWNNGLPIAPDKIEKIFQPFYTTKTHGTGLGLPICKKIIEDEHKGKIKVTSDANGTTFTIVIPKVKKEDGELG